MSRNKISKMAVVFALSIATVLGFPFSSFAEQQEATEKQRENIVESALAL